MFLVPSITRMASYMRKTTWENLYTKLLTGEVLRGDGADEKALHCVLHPVALCAMPWEEAMMKMGDKYTVRNRCDLLLGFEMDKSAKAPVTIDVGLGPQLYQNKLTVTPGGFVPAMKGVHCLPTIALAFHDISVSCSDPSQIHVVQALLGKESRRDLALTGGQHGILLQFDDGYHIIKAGMCQDWVSGRHPRDDPYLYTLPRIGIRSEFF